MEHNMVPALRAPLILSFLPTLVGLGSSLTQFTCDARFWPFWSGLEQALATRSVAQKQSSPSSGRAATMHTFYLWDQNASPNIIS
eukprot:5513120-Amphidinium_carterae.1